MPADVALLQEAPLFALLDDNERQTLADIIDVVHFDKGATIFSFGDVGDTLYVVRDGTVQVYVENYEGTKIILGENTRGDIFGEISLLDGGPRTATAVATEDSDLFALERQDLLDLITKHPHAAMDLLTVVGRRLRTTDELLRIHVAKNVNEEMEDRRTKVEKAADWIAEFSGSIPFLNLHLVFFFVWIVLNLKFMEKVHVPWMQPFILFDPYPFGLLTMAVSLEAIVLSVFVLLSQSRQATKDHVRSDIEYDVNLKAELEVAQLHNKVDRIYEEMQAHFARLHKDTGGAASAGQGTRK